MIAGLVSSILALVVRASTCIRFRNRYLELSHRRRSLVARIKTDERRRRLSCDTITRSTLVKKNVLQRRNQRRLSRRSIRSDREIVNVDSRAYCMNLRGNCYDNHRCYFHVLRPTNYSSRDESLNRLLL